MGKYSILQQNSIVTNDSYIIGELISFMMSDLISIKKDKSTEFKNKEAAAGLQDSSPS